MLVDVEKANKLNVSMREQKKVQEAEEDEVETTRAV